MVKMRKLTATLYNEKRAISNWVMELRHMGASFDGETYKIVMYPNLSNLNQCKIRLEELMEETDCKER